MRMTGLSTAVITLIALLSGNVDMASAQPISPPGGQLKCDVEGGMSFFVGSSRRLDCVFTPTDRPPECDGSQHMLVMQRNAPVRIGARHDTAY
jgi:hypothetical protein